MGASAPACAAPKTEADVYGDEETSYVDDACIHSSVVQSSWKKIPSEKKPPTGDPMMDMVPQTFADMYAFNQPVMMTFDESKKGINMEFTTEIIPVFGSLVEKVNDPPGLKALCAELSPKVAAKGCTMDGVNFFRDVMCATLRSLLPAEWDIKHEAAWKWFWDKVSKSFTVTTGFASSCVQSDYALVPKEQPPPPEGADASMQIPCTFAAMSGFNLMVLTKGGIVKSDMAWTGEFTPIFTELVEAYNDEAKFDAACSSAAEKLKGKATADSLMEFKIVMLASLRSLLPQRWGPQNEAAWSAFWKKAHTKISAKL